MVIGLTQLVTEFKKKKTSDLVGTATILDIWTIAKCRL